MRRWSVAGSLLLLVAALWALLLWKPEQARQGKVAPDAPPDPAPVAAPAPPASELHAAVRPPPPPAASPAPRRAAPEPAEPEPEAQPPASSPSFKLPKLPPPEPSGPVSALKLRFGNESSSADSKLHEQQLTAALQRTGPPPGSVENVVCRRTVCRVSWRWKAEHVIPFYQAIGALRLDIAPSLGIDAAKPAADDTHSIDIYLDVTSHGPGR